ncbi:MAG TPA: ATP-binding protein [Trebonia sp.]|jgi:anti-sigma regulatory factor (Ser/Thr protein kinase)|nr:ATP-binding protein [Trebonia sp.]
MTPMAPTRPIRPIRPPDTSISAAAASAANGVSAGIRVRRVVRLAPKLSAVAAARAEVEAAICAWCVAVDSDVAVLLTSELVTNAVTHAAAGRNGKPTRRGGAAEAVLLVIAADDAGLRVDVHDGSGDLPVLADCPAEADAETGRGLLLVTSLSSEWGFHRTPGGKVVYFTLQAQADVNETVIDGKNGHDPRSVS